MTVEELSKLDDVAFLEHCREVRESVQCAPAELDYDERVELARVEQEFLRRAGMAWQRAW